MDKLYIQITSGRGPAECCRVVARVTEIMMKEAALKKLQAVVIDKTAGDLNRTLKSVIMELCGEDAHGFVQSWTGVIQWISQSPYRKFHKRKNWFIGVQSIRMPDQFIEDKDICYQTLRASGPGGQHVNRTESAVRAIHRPSGISVLVSDQRSQHQNKKLATERLRIKLAAWQAEQLLLLVQDNWQQHNELERGNPIKVINMRLDS